MKKLAALVSIIALSLVVSGQIKINRVPSQPGGTPYAAQIVAKMTLVGTYPNLIPTTAIYTPVTTGDFLVSVYGETATYQVLPNDSLTWTDDNGFAQFAFEGSTCGQGRYCGNINVHAIAGNPISYAPNTLGPCNPSCTYYFTVVQE